jgi:chloride channel protein, CIC family
MMKNPHVYTNGIPISVSLRPALEAEHIQQNVTANKSRLITISVLALLIACLVSIIAKLLVYLIDLFTNIAFHGTISTVHIGPAGNSLGIFVIIVPVAGGIIVGFMAMYGSKAIRGHGIPEAMEQILVNQSRIKPSITFLKPLSSAISIGTGGPFGAEGPIIATGGALGSTIGQLFKISSHERKILLAAGAAAGMSAIFGSPIAAIFLAIELLLFEFSHVSIIPVALACITGAAAHVILFGPEPVFGMNNVIIHNGIPALAGYAAIGLFIGVMSALVTRIVFIIEDGFGKLPVHWMWWPAIGGLAVGIIGYYAPRTLGVGYENIRDILTGHVTLSILLTLAILKFISWAIALGSGTSGGTLAPLLTIGGAIGALAGKLIIYLFPYSGVSIPVCALVGMSAMFAGASRALMTSIIFALETTLQINALLPLLAACITSYFISFFLMDTTIMTEKISRRGIKTPHSYEPDVLEKLTLGQVIKPNEIALSSENTIIEIREWLISNLQTNSNYFIVVTNDGEFRGIVSLIDIYSRSNRAEELIDSLIKKHQVVISIESNLRTAVEIMAREDLEVLPVVSKEEPGKVIGILSYKDILSAYSYRSGEHEKTNANISLKRQGLKILVHGQKLFNLVNRMRNG